MCLYAESEQRLIPVGREVGLASHPHSRSSTRRHVCPFVVLIVFARVRMQEPWSLSCASPSHHLVLSLTGASPRHHRPCVSMTTRPLSLYLSRSRPQTPSISGSTVGG
ncbi:hypothetical protein I4F81_008888 [Pyropia yezoensis]|uniref:Uncharacterized protein n=1 Tax=Pyropia yezoensis TaxID=2788 RepID=A0ACC3C911_PYRYE|nr:hypothetical protein I4F81_008888 [Neopyropia yezoensis]